MKSSSTQKILLLLAAGLAFGFSYTPHRQWQILKGVSQKWKAINDRDLKSGIRSLRKTKLIQRDKNKNGSYTVHLTDKGKLRVLTYYFEKMKIDRRNWDGKWRLVIFDIPESFRKGRDALRRKLKQLGFRELQKSVFVFPYECKNEIDFLVELFNIKKYIHSGILESVDNEAELKDCFGIK